MMRRLTLLLALCSAAHAGYLSKATVNFSGAATSTQTNITLLFTFSDAKLKTVANGGQIQNLCSRNSLSVPCDFVFTNDTTCATLTGSYTWGFDGDYSATAGTGHGWIMIPSYTTSGVTPTVCVGNSAVTTYQGGSVGAEFDANTKGAWHLPNGTSLTANDFTANGYNATAINCTVTAGQIDGGATCTGAANKGIDFGANLTALQPAASVTVEAWVNLATTSQNSYAWIVTQDYITPRNTPYSVYGLEAEDAGVAQWAGWFGFGGAINKINSGVATTTGWHHIAMSVTSGAQVMYVDGVAHGGTSVTGTFSYNSTGHFMMAENSDGGENMNGKLDEVRVSSTVRSANWIATEYANQNSPPSVGVFTSLATTFVANPSVIVVP